MISKLTTAWKVSKYAVFSGPYLCIRTEYGYLLHIQSECRKIQARKNSIFGHFSRSALAVEWWYQILQITSKQHWNTLSLIFVFPQEESSLLLCCVGISGIMRSKLCKKINRLKMKSWFLLQRTVPSVTRYKESSISFFEMT